jgi:hypothetical protein
MKEDKKEKSISEQINDSIRTNTLVESQESENLIDATADDLAARAAADIKKQEELDEQSGQAFLEAALSELSFGASDQALKKAGLATSQELRERRETGAGTAGTVTGLVGGLLIPGGVGKVAGAGLKSATKAGKFAEKVTAKALAKGAENSAVRRMAKDIVSKGVGGAVEAVPYAGGQLIREDALGTADFNADNLMASVGAGAFIGGGIGSLIGGVKALAPLASKSTAAKKAASLADENVAAAELVGYNTPNKINNLKNKFPLVFKNLANYLRNDLKIGAFTKADDLLEANESILRRSGKALEKIFKKADDFVESKALNVNPTYQSVGIKLKSIADSISDKLKGSGVMGEELKQLRKFAREMAQLAQTQGNIPLARLQQLRKNFDDALYGKYQNPKNPMNQLLREARGTLRKEIDDVLGRIDAADAEGALGGLLTELKKNNLQYHIAATIKDTLDKKALKGDTFIGLKDAVLGGFGGVLTGDPGIAIGISAARRLAESDFRRRMIVMAAANDSLRAAQKAVNKSMQNFASGARKVAVAASTKALASSNFANKIELGKKPKKPKDRKEAYNNLRENIDRAVSDPDFLARRMMVSNSHIKAAMPETAAFIEDRVLRAVNFLNSKLPVNQNVGRYPHMKREFEPSSFELARFERYLQVIENPLSILEDLESRSLTRDHVEAMAAVYPNLYERMRDKAMEVAADPKTNLGYDQRIQLGILMEFDSDPSLEPMRVRGLQANFGQEQDIQAEAEMQEGAVKPTVGGLKEVQFAERQKTSRMGNLIRRQG